MTAATLFILGAIVASFVGVIVERVYTGQSWLSSRSRCDSCARELSPLDLVPILSWIVSFGKCRSCEARISAMHLVWEVVLGSVFLLGYITLGFSPLLLVYLLFVSLLLFIVRYDIRHTIVPLLPSLVLVLLGGIYAYFGSSSLYEFGSALLVAGGVGAFFFVMHLVSFGKAMGLGDTPVALALALFSFPYAFSGLLFSFWIGAVIGIILLLLSKRRPTMKREIPFVPFLAVGFLLAYFVAWNPFHLIL